MISFDREQQPRRVSPEGYVWYTNATAIGEKISSTGFFYEAYYAMIAKQTALLPGAKAIRLLSTKDAIDINSNPMQGYVAIHVHIEDADRFRALDKIIWAANTKKCAIYAEHSLLHFLISTGKL